LKLVLPLPPSLPNLRLHWSAQARLVRNFKDVTYLNARGQRRPPRPPPELVRIDARFYGWNLRDEDNLVASLKLTLDALVDAGFIAADDPKHMELGEISQEIDRKDRRLEVTITPIRATSRQVQPSPS